ncbi:MAG: UDP-2,4-diacetamido-2,4,6-trideoxy-beta-L-altropyranose hydrolase [Alphaproteobacteria bacterium]|nr:UDP-2,4-diacetamido-2,4,6-trideoxy-beta-L-altropyranose hydrolase [Alphaproteobacteria bacterium]
MSGGTVVFRCDASPSIGGGHVARCLGYADAFAAAGHRVLFAISPETIACAPGLDRSAHARLTLAAADEPLAQVLEARGAGTADVLVLDLFGSGRREETAARPAARRLVVVDDMHDRPHACDVLVNTSASATPSQYAGLVPEGCRLLLGPGYAPLAPAFAALREATLKRRETTAPVARVLVGFGLTDPVDATSVALEALRPIAPPQVDVVIGAQAPHLARVRATCAGWATLHVDTAEMPRLMAEADLAIGAAGSTAWERCCLGLPSVAIAIVDNQQGIAAALERAGAATVFGDLRDVTVERLRAAIASLLAEPTRRIDMARAAAAMCDGIGARRLVEVLAA